MFEQNKVEKFYDDYGIREWERLDKAAYGRLIYLLHTDFLDGYIGNGKKVLDAGCGGGRFSIYMARKNSRVTLLDLSQTQLDIAKEKCKEVGVTEQIDGFIHASVTDLSAVADDTFDTAVCYGAVLNYLHEDAEKALSELIRVTKNGGEILLSVNNLGGVLRACATELKFPLCDFWGVPEKWGIREVIETGDEISYPGAEHPPRHYFSAEEIKKLLTCDALRSVELGAAPAVMTGLRGNTETLYQNKTAWETIVAMEKSQYRKEFIADCGEFLLARATVSKKDEKHRKTPH